MATNYPTSLDNGTSLPYPSATDDTNSPSLSGGQDNQNDAVIAVETLLGTNSTQTAPVANTVLVSSLDGTSTWAQLTSSYVSSSTGTGDFVFATSPTLATPTLTSPIISNPSISGSTGNITTGSITSSGLITANAGITTSSITNTGALTNTGLITANGGLDVAGTLTLPAGSITFADLLSTIFSGQVSTQANAANAGGNIWWVNLGGIKVMWAQGSDQSDGGAGTYLANFSLPTFFTTIQAILPGSYASGNATYFWINAYSTSSVTVGAVTVGAATFQLAFIAIGT